MEQPTLITERLKLRPLEPKDAKCVRALAGDWRVARMTVDIPQPYEPGMAEGWIASLAPAFAQGEKVVFGLTQKESGGLVGTVGLKDFSGEAGMLVYWVGVSYWGRGYCTEAVRSVVDYGFKTLGLSRIHARYIRNNKAAGRVLEKTGFQRTGEAMVNAQGLMRRLEEAEIQRPGKPPSA